MRFLLILAAALAATPVAAQTAPKPTIDPATYERYVASLWSKAPADWAARNAQDETQKLCSETRNEPTQAMADAIVAREKAAVILPADGKVTGDWKKGRTVAQRGTGGQFTDAPGTYQGGNCYACHQLSHAEVSYGTLGPSLLNYGKDRGFTPEAARDAYVKIYNAQAVLACSMMPRFGTSKFLTEEQIKDVVAYLFDPKSPVNDPTAK